MTRMRVTPMQPGHYGVEVTEGDRTGHEVVLDRNLLDELGLTGYDGAVVAEETVDFLLDRETGDAIGRRVSIRDVDRRYPGFRDEIVTRVTARATE